MGDATWDSEAVLAAFWSGIQEPGDPAAHRLRAHLGTAEASAWVMSDRMPSTEGFPQCPAHEKERAGMKGRSRVATPKRTWRMAWESWHQRAVESDPDEDLAHVAQLGGRLLHPGHPEWPENLEVLDERTPPALWVIGNLPGPRSVAIVGSRSCTPYGQKVAADLAYGVAEAGLTVVSGGAFGIDIAAHRGALAAGETVAVLAGGLARPYPDAHEGIFKDIAGRGGLVAESPPSWRPARWRFLERNRLIAALAHVTVVVEAALRSGALSTIRQARRFGRQVCAVPGPVTSETSVGPHLQIRENATLVTSARDVLEAANPIGEGPPMLFEFGEETRADKMPEELRIAWDALPKEKATTVRRVAVAAGMSEPEATSALESLRLEGLVIHDSEGWARAVEAL